MDALANRFYAAVRTFWRGLESEVCKEMASALTGPQMYMLHYIHRERQCKLTQVAEMLEVKPSAVTVMVDRLEKAGYVVRANDPADRRAILVEVTPLGEEVLARAVRKRDEIVEEHLARLTPDERRLVTELVEKLTGGFGA
ncbi:MULTISPECIES: MarR family winged helix-turn-helix transcriptional regulator [Paenibacillus]|uniref:MarR family transcriptional regulator n=1 Tax=Paenibacillus albilobatus TaxID=2716884 RepID=A0A919XHL0_9BACL|nr:MULTISPECIES: MarR family transcriptional regulator [Paenibacillus]MDR9852759.1 MarR family transcriptional regulator [Paenibacillus sp. VCA1]GIO30680.1 MarR family transcriptional regulator [Paenibacillus albilobatus]